ncbi:MAG: phospholipase D family protein, partial [Actinomycetota bacterium]|nr:phospholipase D family protein [Actinomycetota bacterium]
AQFLLDLLPMCSKQPVPDDRAAMIRDVARTLGERSLAVPAPFTAGAIHPLGTSQGRGWPMPAAPDTALVISPFLDVTTVRRLPAGSTIISRAEAFDRLGAAALSAHDLRVLQPHADALPDDLEAETAEDSAVGEVPTVLEVKSGLHAKVLAWDEGRIGHLLTGSANATSAAFGGNVEFGVLLSGPVSGCGAAAILKDDEKAAGFTRLLQPHAAREEPVPDVEYVLERELEVFHAALAGCGPELHIATADNGYEARLAWSTPYTEVGTTWVRPVTVKPSFDRLLGDRNAWQGLGVSDLTTFVAVRTRLERDGVTVERASALRVTLVGAPEDRARRVLRELLSKVEDVLKYLALLLKDPGLDDVASAILEVTYDGTPAADGPGGSSWVDDLVLLEPLVRAFARDDGGLDRVERLLDDLRDDDGRLPNLGPDFESLWQVVTSARGTR